MKFEIKDSTGKTIGFVEADNSEMALTRAILKYSLASQPLTATELK